jgi:hypothetical protein
VRVPRKAVAKKPAKKAPAVKKAQNTGKKAAGTKKPAPKKGTTKPPPPKPIVERHFGARGQRIWDEHHLQVIGEHGLAVLEEACRTADRLDRLHALLTGDAG